MTGVSDTSPRSLNPKLAGCPLPLRRASALTLHPPHARSCFQIADKRFNSNLSRYTTTIDKSGTPNLTNDGNYNAARVLQTNAFFLFLSAVLMVAYFVVWKRVLYPIVIVFVVRGVLGGLLRTFTACCRGRARWKKGEQMDFYEAYRTGRLQGTPTYAIIDQPEFKAHFEVRQRGAHVEMRHTWR